jgi:hypothetical protein
VKEYNKGLCIGATGFFTAEDGEGAAAVAEFIEASKGGFFTAEGAENAKGFGIRYL